MVMVFIVGLMGIDMKDNLKMIYAKGLVLCIGMMEHSIKDNGSREYKMVRGCYQ